MIATPFAAGALLTSAAPPPPCAVCATLSVGAVNQLGIRGRGSYRSRSRPWPRCGPVAGSGDDPATGRGAARAGRRGDGGGGVRTGRRLASAAAASDRRRPGPTPAPTATAAAPTEALPASIDIPRIGVHTTLIQTGLNPDHTLEAPPTSSPDKASRYRDSPPPGIVGPVGGTGAAVILGHITVSGRPAVFARLQEVGAGDTVTVHRGDGSPLTFRVTQVKVVPEDQFPTASVYGPVSTPELRLITCGGELDRVHNNYDSNVVVFATLSTSLAGRGDADPPPLYQGNRSRVLAPPQDGGRLQEKGRLV